MTAPPQGRRFEVEASGALGAGQSRSINFTKRAYSGPWNATVVLTNGEKQRSLEAQTVAATANSRRVHVGQSYASPSMRQTMLSGDDGDGAPRSWNRASRTRPATSIRVALVRARQARQHQ